MIELFASIIYTTLATSQTFEHRAANRSKAYWLAEEGIEATRSIRDQSFSNIVFASNPSGPYGLSSASTSWAFTGSSDVTDGFTRQIKMSFIDADSRYATSTVTWAEHGVNYSVSLTTILTNWHKLAVTGAAATTIDTSAACVYTLDQRYLGGVKLVNDGTAGAVSVSQIKVAWSPTTGTLNQILAPYPTTVWTGATSTGATTTLATPISFASAGTVATSYMWNIGMATKSFTLTFVFNDGSTKSTTITPALITICL